MRKRSGEQHLWAIRLRERDDRVDGPTSARRFTKLLMFELPRSVVTSTGADLQRFVADVNRKIMTRGVVLHDGQILTDPLGQDEHFDLQYEGDDPGEVPRYREWGILQREYFGLENPYQMIEDADEYTQSRVYARPTLAYLRSEERIAAIVHGKADNYYFYCPCHEAAVVYTTQRRTVCMGCGAMHTVLEHALPFTPRLLLTAEEWMDLFEEGGSRRDDEIELSVIDVRELENAETIWTTDQWQEAKSRFAFFARSSPEIIAEAVRGTEADASLLSEAGFSPGAVSPPVARQISDESIDVGLVENAALSLRDGVAAYVASRYVPEGLTVAIPQIFRGIELLLKARLEEADPSAPLARLSIPALLQRLMQCGVGIREDEAQTIAGLRRVRNQLQHGSAKLNQRRGLALCRKAVVFVDRFAMGELGLWLGDAMAADNWVSLLEIPEISATAERVVGRVLKAIADDPDAEVTVCVSCGRDTCVRHRHSGAQCAFCKYVPVLAEDQDKGPMSSEEAGE